MRQPRPTATTMGTAPSPPSCSMAISVRQLAADATMNKQQQKPPSQARSSSYACRSGMLAWCKGRQPLQEAEPRACPFCMELADARKRCLQEKHAMTNGWSEHE